MASLRQALHDALQQTIWEMLGVRERVVKQARKIYIYVVISAEALDSFKSAFDMNKRGGSDASTLNSSA